MISTFEAPNLDENIFLEELEDVVKAMAAGKTNGEDGLVIEFYREFWDIIDTRVLLVWSDALDKGALTPSLNAEIIKLIPKGDNKDSISN